MRRVVSRDVSHPVASRGRTLDQLLPVFAPPVDAAEGHVAAVLGPAEKFA